MIAKISRGWGMGRLMRYLMGPGQANEHTDQRVIASWDGAPHLHQPPRNGSACGFDVRGLTEDLNDPALAAGVPLEPPADGHDTAAAARCGTARCATPRPTGCCRMRSGPRSSRTCWTAPASAGRDDPGGCRWVAVRHAEDHIHVAAMLVRQDTGRRVHPWRDYLRAREVCQDAERRFGLTSTAPADRTAAPAIDPGGAGEGSPARRRRDQPGMAAPCRADRRGAGAGPGGVLPAAGRSRCAGAAAGGATGAPRRLRGGGPRAT